MELMKQKQYSPLSVAGIAVSLYAVENGYVDDVELEKVSDFEAALHDFMHGERKQLVAEIQEKAEYTDEIASALKDSLEEFRKNHTW